MNIICAPDGIIDIDRPRQGAIDIVRSGFCDVLLDASLACTPIELRMTSKVGQNKINQRICVSGNPTELYHDLIPMLVQCRQTQLHTTLAYAPYLERASKHVESNQLMIQLAEESIKVCREAKCQAIIIRPLFSGIEPEDEWAVNKKYYLHLAGIAREHNVTILLENQCRDLNGHLIRGICSNGKTASKWIDELNKEVGEERFGFCLDVGVCNLCGQNMYDFVLDLGSRLKAVNLRDCDGQTENAMLPFTCVNRSQPLTDWLSLIRGLRDIGFDGHLILSFGDTAKSFSPILRTELMQLARSVANYFQWQIEIENLLKKYKHIVLFGAGNMCRNFMKCYGEKYPPLYTCDNNRSIWGTEFCGLEVRSPDSLLELPEGCGIFICNIYYREIQEQLNGMGIKNIEFFNDEYMPSYFFDRLGSK
ncbi:MAG: sugar phosphate isomerase/epimerase [Paenibacillaceae bacterium]|nr:sugar phosphate isomerase/epimerase [Paenibacillaceae bacterium]